MEKIVHQSISVNADLFAQLGDVGFKRNIGRQDVEELIDLPGVPRVITRDEIQVAFYHQPDHLLQAVAIEFGAFQEKGVIPHSQIFWKILERPDFSGSGYLWASSI